MDAPEKLASYEAEMLCTYRETVDSFASDLAAAGLTTTGASLRRWGEGATYGSEIEMSLTRDGQYADAVHDLLLVIGGRSRGVSVGEVVEWVTSELRSACSSQHG
jgi:hypothetical protein